MANVGISPLDPSTPLGQLRASVGDTNAIPLIPESLGYANYSYFGDVELTAYLASSSMNPTRATGFAILALARNAAMTGRSIKTDDLGHDNKGRGDSLEKIAASWFRQTDAEDERANSFHFELTPPAPRRHSFC